MSFFDTTPLGRILNRFSKDMDIMDVTIPMNFRMLCSQLYNVVGTIVVICYTIPIFTAVVIPIAIMYYLLQKFYVSTARYVHSYTVGQKIKKIEAKKTREIK